MLGIQCNGMWQVWVPNMASVRGENEEKIVAVGSTKVCDPYSQALAMPHPHIVRQILLDAIGEHRWFQWRLLGTS